MSKVKLIDDKTITVKIVLIKGCGLFSIHEWL